MDFKVMKFRKKNQITIKSPDRSSHEHITYPTTHFSEDKIRLGDP